MYNISISTNGQNTKDFQDLIDISGSLGINNLEISNILDGIDIVELSGAELKFYRNLLISYFKKIVLLESDRSILDEAYYRRLFRNAHLLGIENINVSFTFAEKNETELAALKKVISIGRSYGIGVMFENSSTSPYSHDKDLASLYNEVKSDSTGIIFNPLEYCRMKSHPFFHEYYNSKLKKEIYFLRVNDGLFKDGTPALPCEGNAEIKEMVSILLSIGFKGYFSIKPYFEDTQLEKYKLIASKLKNIFKTI